MPPSCIMSPTRLVASIVGRRDHTHLVWVARRRRPISSSNTIQPDSADCRLEVASSLWTTRNYHSTITISRPFTTTTTTTRNDHGPPAANPKRGTTPSMATSNTTHESTTRNRNINRNNNAKKNHPNNTNHQNKRDLNRLVKQIEACRNAYELSQIIRKLDPFSSNATSRALLQKVQRLAPKMPPRKVSGLLHCLSNARTGGRNSISVPSLCDANDESSTHHATIMSVLAEASRTRWDTFEARDVTILLHSLAKRGVGTESLFQEAAATILPKIHTLDAQGLATLANTFSKLSGHYGPSSSSSLYPVLFETVGTAAIPMIDTFTSQGLANLVHACAKVGHLDPVLFDRVATASIPMIQSFTTQGLANLVNAFSKVNNDDNNFCHPALFEAVATTSIPIIRSFKAQELAALVNAFAKASDGRRRIYHDDDDDDCYIPLLFDEVAMASIPRMESFTPQGLALLVNAFAKMDCYHADLFQAVATTAIPRMGTFSAHELAILIHAFGKVRCDHPPLFDSVATYAIPIMDTFKAQELSSMVNAFANMDGHHYHHQYPTLFEHVAMAAIPILGTFQSQELANLVNAFAKSGHVSHEHGGLVLLFEKVGTASIPIIGTFQSQELASLVNAFAKAGHSHAALFDKVATAAITIIHKFNAQELANLVNAFAKGDACSHPELFDVVAATAIPIIHTFKDQELANLVSAFAKVRASGKQVEALFSCVASEILSHNHESSSSSSTVSTVSSYLSKWPPHHLVEVAYAFMKAKQIDLQLLDAIGMAIVSRSELELDAHGMGNLVSCFGAHETGCSATLLKRILKEIQELDPDSMELQNVADICNALWMAQRVQVASPELFQWVVDLAIAKASESRPQDVRSILLGLSCVDLPIELQRHLLNVYKPYFEQHSQHMARSHCFKIQNMYNTKFIKIPN
eukprot:scaffold166572_cov50-Attheya_sp.AAC.3